MNEEKFHYLEDGYYAEELETENYGYKKQVERLLEQVETYKNERDTYKRLAKVYVKKYNKEKEKNKRAINRISIVRMDNDITMETNRVLDYILKSLIGE